MEDKIGRIFLNYRRDDDAGTVGRLFDRLEQVFGREAVFMDVEGDIKAGDDYVDKLRARVTECDVLIAVIGPRWLTVADETGRRRLDNTEDWVRVEIVTALEAGTKKRIIPVLVPGGMMPRAEDLPGPLKPIARRHAIRLTLERFNVDAQGLIDQIKSVLEDLTAQRAKTEAELKKYRAGNTAAARASHQHSEVNRLHELAAAGNIDAMFRLGWKYANGYEVAKDMEEAARHYRRAAEAGDVRAEHQLGCLYEIGDGVEKNEPEAARLYMLAAEQGRDDAQFRLGRMYAEGRGVQKDEQEAIRLWSIASENGNASAQHALGLCYELGRGVAKNLGEAIHLYEYAAGLGVPDAQFRLAQILLYEEPYDDCSSEYFEKAIELLHDASIKGHAGAKEELERRRARASERPEQCEDDSLEE